MILPVFSENSIPIVLASDGNYVHYLAVMIRSVVLNSSPEYSYDIIVLERCIVEQDKISIISDNAQSNVSIRFYDIHHHLKEYADDIYLSLHFTELAYARLFIPKIFDNYKKMLYLDSDMVVLADVAELYSIDIGDNIFGAAIDGIVCNSKELLAYNKNNLKLKEPKKYKNSGVLIVNVEKMITDNIFDKLLIKLREIKTPTFVDQCIINATCEDNIYELGQEWNVMLHYLLCVNGDQESNVNRSDMLKIIHYCGRDKPDNANMNYLTEYFFKYAKQTSFYDIIFITYIFNTVRRLVKDLIYNHVKCTKYRLLKKTTFGLIKNVNERERYYKKTLLLFEQSRCGVS